jgi:spore coat polysaccharide biosynthesis protein SpsF
MDIGGETALSRVVRRLSRATMVHRVLVATTNLLADDAIVRECEYLGVPYFRGSEDDVLDRYYRAARAFGVEAVVRITSDCPLIDPEVVDQTVDAFHLQKASYASNAFPRTYPRGLDTEVFTTAALSRAWQYSGEAYQREHVTPYLYEHPEIFPSTSIVSGQDYSHYRWTLDTSEDLKLIRAIYSAFDNRDNFRWQDAAALMERQPELYEINSNVVQKAVGSH